MCCVIDQKSAVLTDCQTVTDAGFYCCNIPVRTAGVRDTMRWSSIFL